MGSSSLASMDGRRKGEISSPMEIKRCTWSLVGTLIGVCKSTEWMAVHFLSFGYKFEQIFRHLKRMGLHLEDTRGVFRSWPTVLFLPVDADRHPRPPT